jgi:hypothetical protein
MQKKSSTKIKTILFSALCAMAVTGCGGSDSGGKTPTSKGARMAAGKIPAATAGTIKQVKAVTKSGKTTVVQVTNNTFNYAMPEESYVLVFAGSDGKALANLQMAPSAGGKPVSTVPKGAFSDSYLSSHDAFDFGTIEIDLATFIALAEFNVYTAIDFDDDGMSDFDDADDDGDGSSDLDDLDDDGDGVNDDLEDGDTDGDGLCDMVDGDDDGDGINDSEDGDDDGDGVDDEVDQDRDEDGIADDQDDDDDNDGVPDSSDNDDNGDGVDDASQDQDGDGTPDYQDDDIDGDGEPNDVDMDDDNDGTSDQQDMDHQE